jgi:exodeoxyribonuclease VII large subunit
LLKSLSYKDVLRRGYVVVSDENGRFLPTAAAIHPGQALRLEFADGRRSAVAGETLED